MVEIGFYNFLDPRDSILNCSGGAFMIKEEYINLKEASKISGYSPDYLGQLLRQGKIQGRQVLTNVSWMTTEQAVLQYMEDIKSGKGEKGDSKGVVRWCRRLRSKFLFEFELIGLYRTVLYTTIILSIFFSLFLFYVFSISLDSRFKTDFEHKFFDDDVIVPEGVLQL
jgi:hypothetical protein